MNIFSNLDREMAQAFDGYFLSQVNKQSKQDRLWKAIMKYRDQLATSNDHHWFKEEVGSELGISPSRFNNILSSILEQFDKF
ncbi:MAG: hypothetical protein AAFU67_17035, partial [Bacteroidota bacterium]